MKYLKMDNVTLENLGAIETAREIAGQPHLWEKIYEKVLAKQQEIDSFLSMVF